MRLLYELLVIIRYHPLIRFPQLHLSGKLFFAKLIYIANLQLLYGCSQSPQI